MSERAHRWLSEGAESLALTLQEAAGGGPDCDVLIVGSGYGAAVAAARLAGSVDGDAPARVWLLERGAEIQPGRFPSRWAELPGHVRFSVQGRRSRGRDEGLFDLRIGSDVSLLLGNGLGGGSLINAGVMLEPDAAIWAQGWPAGIDAASMAPHYQAARDMLRPRPHPQPDSLAKYQLFAAAAGTVGVTVDPAPVTVCHDAGPSAAGVPMAACTACGDCATGCNQGAKGSLDTNYLAAAWSAGARLYCGATVERLERSADGVWLVHWRYSNGQLHASLRPPRPLRARRVVLGGGSLGSTEILLRSRAALGIDLAPVGQRFSINGDAIGAAVGHARRAGTVADAETDPASRERRVGSTINGVARLHTDTGTPFAVEEFGVPAALRNALGEVAAMVRAMPSFMGESDQWVDPKAPLDADAAAVTNDLIQRSSVYGLMGDDGAAGRLEPVHGACGRVEGVRVEWPQVHALPHFAQMHAWLRRAMTPAAAVSSSTLAWSQLPAMAVHPLGGCAMADRCSDGVVNAWGEVFDRVGADTVLPGLVVLDGAIVPRALGINPALTIAALAERALPELMRRWHLSPGTQRRDLPARPHGRRVELPAPSSTWTLREVMRGPCRLGGQDLNARMELEFEPLPGLRRSFAAGERLLAVRRGTLTLSQPVGTGPEAEDRMLAQAELGGSVEVFTPMPDPKDRRVRLVYRLSLLSVAAPQALPLRVGMMLSAEKHWGLPRSTSPMKWRSPLRDLTELDVKIDGQGPWRWTFDYDDQADRSEVLLAAQHLTSLPDALDDLIGLAGYALRRTLLQLLGQHGERVSRRLARLRYPGRWLGGPRGQVVKDPQDGPKGWRLTRYRPDRPQGAPVLLIHGLGTSGASFTQRAIGRPLAQHLFEEERDVWVLDLRSSIGNEDARRAPQAVNWTVDQVAQDIAPALAHVHRECKQSVDVVAHCMGAVMFILAALGDRSIGPMVRTAVLSQVGPLARLSPLNRLRGTLGEFLRTYFNVEEFDPTPEVRLDGPGPSDEGFSPGDLVAAAFPYDDDDLADEARKAPDAKRPFRRARRRADAIFGQLFRVQNMAPKTLGRLPALLGWVKVGMLAQAIQFLRLDMLANASGRNDAARRQTFNERFAFPVLFLHGRDNRVFAWRGSLRSLHMLRALRGEPKAVATPDAGGAPVWRYGEGSRTQLALFEGYGHLDMLLGQHASVDVFPTISAFQAARMAAPRAPRARGDWQREIEAPWIGPMLGWLRPGDEDDVVVARLLLHAAPRRSRTNGIAAVPMRAVGGRLLPILDQARWLRWGSTTNSVQTRLDLPLRMRHPALANMAFALLTLHKDLPLDGPLAPDDGSGEPVVLDPQAWIADTAPLKPAVGRQVADWIEAHRDDGLLESALVRLSEPVLQARDRGQVLRPPRPLTFALSSCQYPAGLFDAAPADATWRRLLADLAGANAPQFMLLAGDQVYLDETGGLLGAATGAEQRQRAIDRSYERTWRLPAFRRVAARLPLYPMLDDHEVRDNWQGRHDPVDPAAAQAALQAYDRLPGALAPSSVQRRIGRAGSRSYSLHPAGVPLLVLDTRSGRELRQVDTIGTASLFDDGTWADLERRLRAAPAEAVKLVLSPVPLLPPERLLARPAPERLNSDTWSGFPASAWRLLHLVGTHRIRRLVLLSGDSHLSSVSTLQLAAAPGLSPQVITSIVSSGSYTPWPFANQRRDELMDDGPCSFDGPPGEPAIVGELRIHAMSSRSGYALVRIEPGERLRLRVSFHGGDGSTVDVPDLALD